MSLIRDKVKAFLVFCIALFASNAVTAADLSWKEMEGTIRTRIVDYLPPQHPTQEYWLYTTDGRIRLLAVDNLDLQTGMRVSVNGLFAKQALHVQELNIVKQPQVAAKNLALGTINLGVFLINFTDAEHLPNNINDAERKVFTSIWHAGAFVGDLSNPSEASAVAALERFSFGQLDIETDTDGDGQFDIFGVYDINSPVSECVDNPQGYDELWDSLASAAITQDGIDLSQYTHRLYIVPSSQGCNWRGIAEPNDPTCEDGCWMFSVLGSLEHTAAHEIGHTLGLSHTKADLNGDGQILFADGEFTGDRCTLMSGGCGVSGDQMIALQRYELGWYDAFPNAFSDISASGTGTGTYSISNMDNVGENPHALYFSIDDSDLGIFFHFFSLSYRQRNAHPITDFDYDFFGPAPEIANTIRIHQCNPSNTLGDFNCRAPRLEGAVGDGEVFEYRDALGSGTDLGIWVLPHNVGQDVAEVDVYIGDSDEDGVFDYEDNCYLVANSSQYDSDCDGFGNLCDADFDNNNTVNAEDVSIFSQYFLTDNADTDINGDGVTNFLDFALLVDLFLQPPGPAGPGNACATNTLED